MPNIIVYYFIICLTSFFFAQNIEAGERKINKDNLPVSLTSVIPTGFSVFHVAVGDLNRDEFDDIVLVIKNDREKALSDVVEHPEMRPLFLFMGQLDNTFKLAGKNDHAVYCIDCGGMMGDPFTGIVIKNGYFSIEHYGGSAWRWTRIVTFKYHNAKKQWFLHKDGGDYFHINDPGKAESKVKTVQDFGILSFEDYDIYKEHE